MSKADSFTVNAGLITEKGLKALISAFARTGQKLTEFDGSNKAKNEDGQAIKTFTLYFDSGQSMTGRVNASGDMIQTKLNGHVIPIRPHKTLNAYAKEVTAALDNNQDRFDKALARKAQKVIAQAATTAVLKKTNDSILKEAEAAVAQGQLSISQLESKIKNLEKVIVKKETKLAAKKAELAIEKTTESSSIDQLATLEKGKSNAA